MGNGWEYQIRVEGRIGPRWLPWFDGLVIRTAHEERAGQADETFAITTLTGVLPDEAALVGLLQKLYTLGLPLVEVKRKKSECIDNVAGEQRGEQIQGINSDS